MLVLEEEECDYDENDPSQLDKFGRTMLHGKGYDRWYDKSFNVIVMKNGKVSTSESCSFQCVFFSLFSFLKLYMRGK